MRPILSSLSGCLLIASLTALSLPAPIARADTLELKDGRMVEGMLIPDTDPKLGRGFYVVSRFGPTFIPASRIKARHVGKPVDEQIKAFLAKLQPRDVKNRVRLATWMKGIGREEEARALATQILVWAPENAAAHGLLGHVRYKGRWVTPEAAKRAEGYEKHGDTWYTPQEWKNVANADKAKAAALEKAAAAKRLRREVNQAVRLALSPDPAVRARGKARLKALEKEFDSAALHKLVAGLDDYIKRVDDLRRKAAAAAANVSADGGMVMGEIRATLSRLKRPIQTFETNLSAGPVGANAPVKIQLPELEVIKVRTGFAVPAVVK